MTWILLALLAPFFWSISNFIDKYVIDKRTKGIFDFLFFSTISGWLFFILILIFRGIPSANVDLFMPFFSGMLITCSYWFYGKALEKGDASSLVILFKLIPVFTLIIGFLFLGQVISQKDLFAFFIILIGAVVVSLESKNKRLLMDGFKFIIISIIIWAFTFSLSDYALTKLEYWDFITLYILGASIIGPLLLLFPFMRKEIIEGIKTATVSKYGWFLANDAADFSGHMIINKALAIAPSVGLVTVIMQVQSFYAILMGVFLTAFFPNIIKENISGTVLAKKTIGAVIMFSGIYLIFA